MSNQSIFKVHLYGDSLSLPRPNHVKFEERYIWLLKKWWKNKVKEIDVMDKSQGGLTLPKLHEQFSQDVGYYNEKYDVMIIQCGVCDCAPRPIPEKVRKRVSRMSTFFKNMVVKFIKYNRARIIKNIGYWRLVEENEFFHHYMELLKKSVNRYDRIYIINIAPTNEKTEKHSPGFMEGINIYNAIIQKMVKELNAPNVFLINAYDIIQKQNNLNDYIIEEDGHHIKPITHELYAKAIIQLEEAHFVKS